MKSSGRSAMPSWTGQSWTRPDSQGVYDATLTYTPQTRAIRDGEPELNDISIFFAVEEQLGLKLEPKKATVGILVVDRFGKPTEN